MGKHKEAITTLLTQHHQLLMDHHKEILDDPYLRSCKIPLRFKFGIPTPLDLRLGHLLLLWKKVPKINGAPARILEAEGSGFSKKSFCRWYNPATKTVEENFNHNNLRIPYFGVRDAFQRHQLSVDLERIIRQLVFPEDYCYSEQLKFAHGQFKKGARRIYPKLSLKQLNGIYLYMTTEGLVRIEIRVSNLSRQVSYPGLINHKAVYYQALLDDLAESLTASTGFVLMEKTDQDRSLFFSQVIDPYSGENLYNNRLMEGIRELFSGYEAGMQEIHKTLNVHPKIKVDKDILVI